MHGGNSGFFRKRPPFSLFTHHFMDIDQSRSTLSVKNQLIIELMMDCLG